MEKIQGKEMVILDEEGQGLGGDGVGGPEGVGIAETGVDFDGVVSARPEEALPQKEMTQGDVENLMRMIKRQHGAKCTRKGFKDHVHMPAGNKFKRNFERHGSLYGRVSLVQETFNAMQAQAFKDRKANNDNNVAK